MKDLRKKRIFGSVDSALASGGRLRGQNAPFYGVKHTFLVE